jgi:hypothetical protein
MGGYTSIGSCICMVGTAAGGQSVCRGDCTRVTSLAWPRIVVRVPRWPPDVVLGGQMRATVALHPGHTHQQHMWHTAVHCNARQHPRTGRGSPRDPDQPKLARRDLDQLKLARRDRWPRLKRLLH